MPILQSLVAAGIAALITPFILRRLSASAQPSRKSGEYSVAHCSKAAHIGSALVGLLFLLIASLAYRFPGRTEPQHIPWAIAFFALMSALSFLNIAWMKRTIVQWNQTEIQGCDGWGNRHTIAWSELTNISKNTNARAHQLEASNGRIILVCEMLVGYSDFLESAKKYAPYEVKWKI
jgi:hypothetical protein